MKLNFVGGKFMVRELGSLPRSRTFFRTDPHPPRSLRELPPAARGLIHSGSTNKRTKLIILYEY